MDAVVGEEEEIVVEDVIGTAVEEVIVAVKVEEGIVAVAVDNTVVVVTEEAVDVDSRVVDVDAPQSNPLSCADTTRGGLEVGSNSACQPHTILDPEACTLFQLRLLIKNVLESIFVADPW